METTKFKVALILALSFMAIVMVASMAIVNSAMAEGVGNAKNFGQCKQLPSNDQACKSNKDKFTGPG